MLLWFNSSDGRTYKTPCRLLKRSCRRRVAISISYYGSCRSTYIHTSSCMLILIICIFNKSMFWFSNKYIYIIFVPTVTCSKLTCPGKKQCLLDQNSIPHCVNCTTRHCPVANGKSVCGKKNINININMGWIFIIKIKRSKRSDIPKRVPTETNGLSEGESNSSCLQGPL